MQQVPSTPAHCLACSTLPQQTLHIIDVLEWPHHHRILQSGRIIKVITATLTYVLHCNAGSGTSRGVDFLKLLGDYTHCLCVSLCMWHWYRKINFTNMTHIGTSHMSYDMSARLYHIFCPHNFHLCEPFQKHYFHLIPCLYARQALKDGKAHRNT